MVNELRYLGHSAFYIKKDNYGILIDPFLSQNTQAKFNLNVETVTHILVTHGHSDHLGDAIPISKSTGAQIIAMFELANYCAARDAKVIPVGMGGELKLPWGSVVFLPAFHSSSTIDGTYAGMPASIFIDIDGVKIYHAGDTALNMEMKLIGELYAPYYALLPVGGHFTMGVKEAVIAAKYLRATEVIPMHYNTFDVIQADPHEMKFALEAQGQKLLVIEPNESIEI